MGSLNFLIFIYFGFFGIVFAQDDSIHLKRAVEQSSLSLEALSQMNDLICEETHNMSTVLDVRNEKIAINVVSDHKAQELFNDLANQKHIAYRFPEDGCFARAHEMTRILDDKGIVSVKVFVEGKLGVNSPYNPNGFSDWSFHVAPALIVMTQEGEKLFVLDPSLFNRPVPMEEWKAAQIKHEGGNISNIYITKRYIYKREDKLENRNKYDFLDTDRMKEELRLNLTKQRERENAK